MGLIACHEGKTGCELGEVSEDSSHSMRTCCRVDEMVEVENEIEIREL